MIVAGVELKLLPDSRARMRYAWANFRELAWILTSRGRGAPFIVKSRIYEACEQGVMIYGSEMWPTEVVWTSQMKRQIGCPLAEALKWQGQRAGTGAGRHGMSVSNKTCCL